MDEAQESKRLARAGQRIARLETRIAQQREMVERLKKDGHSSEAAEAMLTTLEGTLLVMVRHRERILRTLNKGAATDSGNS